MACLDIVCLDQSAGLPKTAGKHEYPVSSYVSIQLIDTL